MTHQEWEDLKDYMEIQIKLARTHDNDHHRKQMLRDELEMAERPIISSLTD